MSDLQARLQAALGSAYHVERELGGGGMSRVFVAQEVELGRRVVVKVLPPEVAGGVNLDRFRREIQLAASLQHPHVVPLLTAGHQHELLYYTMPLIEGESLRAKLAREGALPVGDAVRILRDVVDALTYAHRHGVVHRDIKPDNVLVADHHAVVTDFGVAKAISESTGVSSLTSVGVALGTPAYMAPEQAAADPHADHRCDLYSVGVLAYEMLTGRPPFTGASPQQVLAAQVSEAAVPVTKHRATVPLGLAEAVMRCLEKNPADRWQTAEELLHLLEAMATPSGGTAPTAAVPGAPARMAQRVPVAVAAGVGVVLLGVIAFLMRARDAGGGATRVNCAQELDPGMVAAPEHLLELAAHVGDTAAVRELGARYLVLDSTGDLADFVRWRVAQALGDSAALSALRTRFERVGTRTLARIVGLAQVEGIGLDDAERALAVLVGRGEANPFLEAFYALNRGQPATATGALQQIEADWGPSMPIWLALFWDADTLAAQAAVARLSPLAEAPLARARAERLTQLETLCMIESWCVARGDLRTVDRGIATLRRAAAPVDSGADVETAHWCALTLETEAAVARNAPGAAAALDRLDSLLRTGPRFMDAGNLQVARLREARGDLAGALRAVRRRPFNWSQIILLSTYLREEGRLAALAGDRDAAIKAYGHYLALRSDPEPALVPEVERVRAELARLVGEQRSR